MVNETNVTGNETTYFKELVDSFLITSNSYGFADVTILLTLIVLSIVLSNVSALYHLRKVFNLLGFFSVVLLFSIGFNPFLTFILGSLVFIDFFKD